MLAPALEPDTDLFSAALPECPMARFSFSPPRLTRPLQWGASRLSCAAPRRDSHPNVPSRGSAGWHDSSWDLTQGLSIHEGLPSDAKLDEWIDAALLA